MYGDHPFLRLDSLQRTDMLADVAHAEVLATGSAFFSQRSLARRMGMSSAGLVHLFGGKEQMLTALTARYGRRWLDWVTRRVAWEGLPAALPRTTEELEGTTMWLALHALGRELAGVGAEVAHVTLEERGMLERAWMSAPLRDVLAAERRGEAAPSRAPAPSLVELDVLEATLCGLRHAMTRRPDPLPVDRALAAWEPLPGALRQAPGADEAS